MSTKKNIENYMTMTYKMVCNTIILSKKTAKMMVYGQHGLRL